MEEHAVLEAESLEGAAQYRRGSLLASGAAVVGGGFGEVGSRVHVPLEAGAPRTLWLRYARRDPSGAELLVSHGADERVLHLESTGHSDRFEWVAVGSYEAQPPRIELRARGDRLQLDQIALLASGVEPPRELSPRVWRAAPLELRAAAGVVPRDPQGILRVIARHQTLLVEWTALPTPETVVLALVADADWPDPATGAFQSGCVAYYPESALRRPWHLWTHELCHLHQAGAATTPTFFTEGMACLMDLLVEARLYARPGPVAAQEVELDSVLREGNGLYRPGRPGVNPIFQWDGEARVPDETYAWSFAVLWDLFRQHGSPLLRAVYTRLQDPADPAVRRLDAAAGELERCRVLVGLLSECAGEDLRPRFRGYGLPDGNRDGKRSAPGAEARTLRLP